MHSKHQGSQLLPVLLIISTILLLLAGSGVNNCSMNNRFPAPRRNFGESRNDYRKRVVREKDIFRKRQREEEKRTQANKRNKALYNDRKRNEARSRRERQRRETANETNKNYFEESTFTEASTRGDTIRLFENQIKKIKHRHCAVCHRTGINLSMTMNGSICGDCKKNNYHIDKEKLIKEGMLPVWYDDSGEAQYKVPEVLSCLRDCEKC